MVTTEELQKFWDQCKVHDWTYHYTDDHSVFEAGERSALLLGQRADELGPEAVEILQGWAKHYSTGPAYGNERHPQPARPE